MKTKTSSGFTLVELSVGIGVISILAGIAVTSLTNTKDDAMDKKREATISAIETAKNRYVVDAPSNVVGQPALLDEIKPYLQVNGEPVEGLFDLVQGTGYNENQLDLGTYNGTSASFDELGTGASLPPSESSLFDPTDPVSRQNALNLFSQMDPSDPAYQDYLNAINDGFDNGDIPESDLVNSNLENVDGTWMNQEGAQQTYAQQASQILTNGGSWSGLTPNQQQAYANAYPSEAVTIGGADALNLMDPSLWVPPLTDGYTLVNGVWVVTTTNGGRPIRGDGIIIPPPPRSEPGILPR